jgi:hypothetical protein
MDYESQVQEFLRRHGYYVEKIPCEKDKSPDFLIRDATYTYGLELKTKFPSDSQVEERDRQLETTGVHVVREPAVRKNTLSGIITDAATQLAQYPLLKDSLRLVWLLSTGHLADARIHQFETTLFGSTQIIDITNKWSGTCYFFSNSDFFRCRDVLDAAIVSIELEPKLLLNPLSPRYEQIKGSSLAKLLAKDLIDPIELEKLGQAFVVEGEVDRNNEEEVLLYLKTKYKSQRLEKMEMMSLSGTLRVPKS